MVGRVEPVMRAVFLQYVLLETVSSAPWANIALKAQHHAPSAFQASLRTRLGAPSAGNDRRVRSPATVVSRGQTAPAIAGIPVQMVDRAEPAMRASSSPSLDQRRAKLALQDRITLCKRSGIGGRVPFVWQASLRTRLGAPSAGNARRIRSLGTAVS